MSEHLTGIAMEKSFVSVKLRSGMGKLHLSSNEKKPFYRILDTLTDEQIRLLSNARKSFDYDMSADPTAGLWRFMESVKPCKITLYLWFIILLTALNVHYDEQGRSAVQLAAFCKIFRNRMKPVLDSITLFNQNAGEDGPFVLFDTEGDRAKLSIEADWLKAWFLGEKEVKEPERTGDPEIYSLLLQARHPYNLGAAAWETEAPLLTLVHFSDPHASSRGMAALLEEIQKYKGLYEDVLCTGDVVMTHNDDSRENYYQVPGIETVLNTVGNHDALNNPFFDWSDRIGEKEAARQFIDPFAENWDVVREPETTYYYKLYEAQKVLLMVLDSNLDGEDAEKEVLFVKETLALAKSLDFTVLGAVHEPPLDAVKVECSFSPYICKPHDNCGPNLDRRIPGLIDAFSKDGGKFSLFLAGHYHDPGIFTDPEYPAQRYVVCGPLNDMKGMRSGTALRKPGTDSDLLANFVTLDTAVKVVKLVRLGSNRDCLLRSQKYLTMNYETGEIIACG